MSSDLIANLHLDPNLTCNTIAVKEINNCDSSFIISCLLNNWIKNKHPVLIISTHNPLLHYQHVGLKMSYNLNKSIETGLVIFYNLGQDIVSNVMFNGEYFLETQIYRVVEKMQNLFKSYKMINIVFDGISHLFDMNFPLKSVNNFVNGLIKAGESLGGSTILLHCNLASEDDVTCTFANLLSHKVNTVLEVEHLQSGLSADVSGHLLIKYPKRKFQEEYLFSLEPRPSKYLFKLYDRGVKLLAPGTV